MHACGASPQTKGRAGGLPVPPWLGRRSRCEPPSSGWRQWWTSRTPGTRCTSRWRGTSTPAWPSRPRQTWPGGSRTNGAPPAHPWLWRGSGHFFFEKENINGQCEENESYCEQSEIVKKHWIFKHGPLLPQGMSASIKCCIYGWLHRKGTLLFWFWGGVSQN